MYETSHRLRKYQCFFSSGPLHYCNGPHFLEMAHNFGNPGAIGPYACFAFPISVYGPKSYSNPCSNPCNFLHFQSEMYMYKWCLQKLSWTPSKYQIPHSLGMVPHIHIHVQYCLKVLTHQDKAIPCLCPCVHQGTKKIKSRRNDRMQFAMEN